MASRFLGSIFVLLSSASVATAQPTIQFKSRELSEGRNYTQQLTAVLSVGESSGTVSYRFPISVPPGRGLTPEVALEYSSNGGASEYGWGWQLTIPMIERSHKQGTFHAVDDPNVDLYTYRNGQETAELVFDGPVEGESLGHFGHQCNRFLERSDRSHSRYVYCGSDGWSIYRTNGTRLDLTTTLPGGSTGSSAHIWMVTTIVETHGNYIQYNYGVDNYDGLNPKIRSIQYTGNTNAGIAPQSRIDFVWNAHWGAVGAPFPVSLRDGFTRQIGNESLDTIVVTSPPHSTAGSPAAVPSSSPTSRTYSFGYTPAAGVTFDNTFYLLSAQVESEPSISFSYPSPQPPNGVFDSQQQFAMGSDFLGLSEVTIIPVGEFGSIAMTTMAHADVNGDGLVDFIKSDGSSCDDGSCAYTVWINHGTSGFEEAHWTVPDAAYGAAPLTSSALREALSAWTSTTPAVTVTTSDFFDLDGDGFPDLVYVYQDGSASKIAYCPGAGSSESTGSGTGFWECRPWGTPTDFAGFLRRDEVENGTGFTVTTHDVFDLNGDGLPDLVSIDPHSSVLHVNFNNGAGFDPTFLSLSPMPSCGIPPVSACLRAVFSEPGPSTPRPLLVDIRDINGDGLPDFVAQDGRGNLVVNLGDGEGFTASAGIITSSAPMAAGVIGFGVQAAVGTGMPFDPVSEYLANDDLIDLNGDGMPDIVHMECTSIDDNGSPKLEVDVRYNNAGVWDAATQAYLLSGDTAGTHVHPCLAEQLAIPIPTPPPPPPPPSDAGAPDAGAPPSTTYVVRDFAAVLDINGDGLPDFVTGGSGGLLARVQSYVPPRKLGEADSLNSNQEMVVHYAAQSGGSAPYPVHAPAQVLRTRGQLYPGEPEQLRNITTSYQYSPALYDHANREFVGFQTVTATHDRAAADTLTNYGTTIDDAGIVYSQVVTNNQHGSGTGVFSSVINFYSVIQIGTSLRSHFARLDAKWSNDRDEIFRETDYSAYDQFQQPQYVADLGEVDPLGGVDLNAAIGHTYTRAIRDDSLFILDLPSTDVMWSHSNPDVATSHYYYDTPSLGATPTNGDLIMVEREVTPGAFVSKETSFDSATGVVSSETDEQEFTTSYTYDTTYSQYRVAATNSLGTTYSSYHALTGQVADSCGLQYAVIGSTTSHSCSRVEIDSLGRTIATWVPTYTAARGYSKKLFNTVTYDDGVYPLMTTVTTRGVSHAVQYRDGFGNPVEQRIEETPGDYRVFETAYDTFGKPVRVEQAHRDIGSAYTHSPISPEGWGYVYDYVHDSIEQVTYPRDPGDGSPPAKESRIMDIGHVVRIDPEGRQTWWIFDTHGRIGEVDQLGGSDGTAITLISNNDRGDITQVTDPNGLVTAYVRNELGWTTSVTAPDGGVTAYSFNNRGQVTQTLDPRGVNVLYGYDAAGRPRSVTSSTEPAGVTHVHATYTYGTTAAPTQLGKLIGESSDDGQTQVSQTYTYTAEGAVATHQSSLITPTPSVTKSISFQYDTGNLLTQVTYPDAVTVNYAHNLDDSVAGITDGQGRHLADPSYDDTGRLSIVTNEFGLDESYTYDARGRVLTVSSSNTLLGAGPLVQDSLTWNKSDDLVQLDRSGLAPGLVVRASPDIYTITVDGLDRVTHVTLNGASVSNYSYDLGGRITFFNEQGAAASASTFDFDKLTARVTGDESRTWTYDAVGNVVHDELNVSGTLSRTRDHTWDALGRYVKTSLTGTSGTQYYYTPRGALSLVKGQDVAPLTTAELMIGPFARYAVSGSVGTDEVLLGDRAIVEIRGSRITMAHRSYDQSVLAVSDENGGIQWQDDYRPYGTSTGTYGSGGFEEHFQGLRRDKITVAGTRAYDSEAGNWLGRDTLVARNATALVTEPRLANAYAMDFGNPYRWRDPSGNDPLGSMTPGFVQGLQNDFDTANVAMRTAAAFAYTVQPVTDVAQFAVSLIPFVGGLRDIAAGNYASGLTSLGIDAAFMGGPRLIKGAGEAGNALLKLVRGGEKVEEEFVTLWRGVRPNPNHPEQFDLALQGIARPRGGHADPFLHNRGNTQSIFTSWTTKSSQATQYARLNGAEGVVMEARIPRSQVHWSPDLYLEGEQLVTGEVTGARVWFP